MNFRYVLLAATGLALYATAAAAQRPSFTALRDSLAAVRDVPLLYRMERATQLPGTAQSIEPVVRRGLIALRIWELTNDRADADRARGVFEAGVQRFATNAWSHYGLAYALARGPEVRLQVPGGVLDDVVLAQSLAEIFKRDPKSRARRALRRALELDSAFAEAAELLSELALADGGRSRELIREARAALIRLAAHGGATAASTRALADVEIALGNYAAASETARGEDAGSLRARAVALLLQPEGRVTGATAYWRGVERLDTEAAAQYYDDLEVLVTPTEAAEWRAADLNARRYWLERFWERRAAEGGITVGERLAEHYRRLAHARARYVRNSLRGSEGAGVLLTDPAAERHPFDDRGVLLIRHGDPAHIIRTTHRSVLPNETWLYNLPEHGRQLFHLVALRGTQSYSITGNVLEALDPRVGNFADRNRAILTLLTDVAPFDTRYQAAASRVGFLLDRDAGASLQGTEMRNALERVEAEYRRGARAALRTDTHVPTYRGDLAFHHDVFSFRTPEARTELTAAVAIPARLLTAASSDGGVIYAVRISVIVVDTLLDVVTRSDTLQRLVQPRALRADEFLRTHVTLNVLPSEHTQYRVVVEDVASGRGRVELGTAVVRDYLRGGIMISDVVLAHPDSAGDWRRGAQRLALLLPRRFAPDRPFTVFYELYNLPAQQSYRTRIVVERADRGGVRGLLGGGSPLVDVSFDDVAQPDSLGVIQETRRLASDLPAGRFRMVITVTTRAGETARTETLFTIEG